LSIDAIEGFEKEGTFLRLRATDYGISASDNIDRQNRERCQYCCVRQSIENDRKDDPPDDLEYLRVILSFSLAKPMLVKYMPIF